jgi:hypothetical protein
MRAAVCSEFRRAQQIRQAILQHLYGSFYFFLQHLVEGGSDFLGKLASWNSQYFYYSATMSPRHLQQITDGHSRRGFGKVVIQAYISIVAHLFGHGATGR